MIGVRNVPVPDGENMGYVYMLVSRSTGWLKIGRSGDYMRRLAQLRSEHPELDWQLQAVIVTFDSAQLEKTLHAAFGPYRITRGKEWFKPADELVTLFMRLAEDQAKIVRGAREIVTGVEQETVEPTPLAADELTDDPAVVGVIIGKEIWDELCEEPTLAWCMILPETSTSKIHIANGDSFGVPNPYEPLYCGRKLSKSHKLYRYRDRRQADPEDLCYQCGLAVVAKVGETSARVG